MDQDKELEKLANYEIEQAVLGVILFDSKNLDRIGRYLTADDFYDPVHALIYDICVDLHANGSECGPIIVDTKLQLYEGYNQEYHRKYITEIAGAVPSLTGDDYAKALKELGDRRRLYKVALQAGDIAKRHVFGSDPENARTELQEEIYQLFADDTTRKARTVSQAAMEWLDNFYGSKDGEGIPSVKSGLNTLDDVFNGFRGGKLYIIGGRPGMGKSTVMVHLARRMAQTHGVGFVSGEMEATELPVMMVTDLMRDEGVKLPYQTVEKGLISDSEYPVFRDCMTAAGELPIMIDDTPKPGLAHIRRFAQQCKHRFDRQGRPFGALFVDYLQIIARNPKLRGIEAIAEITQGLITIAKQLDVPVIAGCQINRGPEQRDDKRPTLADLRESGDIENDAFGVMLLYRPEYYHAAKEPSASKIQDHQDWELEGDRLRIEKPLELIVAKNRRGAKKTVEVWCEIETGAIRDKPFNTADPKGLNDYGSFERDL